MTHVPLFQQKLNEAFEEKLEANKRKAEEATEKNRLKRLKKKEKERRSKLKKKMAQSGHGDDDNDQDSKDTDDAGDVINATKEEPPVEQPKPRKEYVQAPPAPEPTVEVAPDQVDEPPKPKKPTVRIIEED